MEKMKMHSPNLTQDKIARIRDLFPDCITEAKAEDGSVKMAVDFDQLRQELAESIVEGPQERYNLNWPGKREALLAANVPIAKTLRPCREESVNFDTTRNIFIEGDNLDALKLLQENYLGKVGVIYIDPPYNTGKDFLYKDDFSEASTDYFLKSEQRDDVGQRWASNLESNGRFHSAWLTMIYARIKQSRSLLDDHGVIFVSINDKEVHNLRKVLDEVYGASNFVACLIWDKNHSAQAGVFKAYHEYILVYAKDIEHIETPSSQGNELFEAGAMKRESSRHSMTEFTFPAGVIFNAPEGTQLTGTWGGIETVELVSGSMICENGRTKEAVTLKAAYTQKNQMQQYFYGDRESLIDSRGQKITEFYFTSSGKIKIVKARGVETPQTTLKDYGTQGSISTELADLFGLDQSPIDNPKPVEMIKDFVRWFAEPSDIVVDFFSGSATTAHAVMALNAEAGTARRFILVQLPEVCEIGSTAEKSGCSNIAELGRKRIKFAGQRIVKEQGSPGVDIGFRAFKIDSTNMADAYYAPDALDKAKLDLFVDNIKPDRTPEDLLFQVMLDWGVDLALPITKQSIQGKDVFFVDGNVLVSCFDASGSIDEAFVKELAKQQPLRVVFRDAGYKDSAVKINVEQIFKLLSPATEVKCI